MRPYQTPQGKWTWVLASTGMGDGTSGNYCPYGQPGDVLWVREKIEKAQKYGGIGFPADGTFFPNQAWHWKRDVLPSIHMPRWASRLTLEITDVRVQRLQDISEEDAKTEGIAANEIGWLDYGLEPKQQDTWLCPRQSFRTLWQSINGPQSWNENAWVWALTFKVHHQNVDDFLRIRAAA